MYRNCIFCSADLGANEAIEEFPVGRSIAFDGEKGRLWAVCPRCARWNLAPLEERWEAIEAGERLFRDSRLRAQSENVGLARLRDGTRLIRVGAALPGELALWRYGRQLERRRMRAAGPEFVALAFPVIYVAGALVPTLLPMVAPVLGLAGVHGMWREAQRYRRARHVAHRVPAGAASPGSRPLDLRWRDLARVRTGLDDHGDPELHLSVAGPGFPGEQVTLSGVHARNVLAKALLGVNHTGARPDAVRAAVDLIAEKGGAAGFVRRVAAEGWGLAPGHADPGDPVPTLRALGRRIRHPLSPPAPPAAAPPPIHQLGAQPGRALALEMALHDEQERQAMEGELSGLEAAWRQAEDIASIADALPDGLEPPEPPRIILPR